MCRSWISFLDLPFGAIFNNKGRVSPSSTEVVHNRDALPFRQPRPRRTAIWDMDVAFVGVLGNGWSQFVLYANMWWYRLFLENTQGLDQGHYARYGLTVPHVCFNCADEQRLLGTAACFDGPTT